MNAWIKSAFLSLDTIFESPAEHLENINSKVLEILILLIWDGTGMLFFGGLLFCCVFFFN